jgi:hypothetical protein
MAKKEGLNKLFGSKTAVKKEPVEVVEPKKEKVVEMSKEKQAEEVVKEVEIPVNESYEDEPQYQSPIAEPVVERTYNQVQVDPTIGDIEEPDYSNAIPTYADEEQEKVVEKEPSPFENVTNPAMEDLDAKDKKVASEQLVDTVLDAYQMGGKLFQKLFSLDESKVQENVINGRIDLGIKVPLSETVQMNALEYVQNHNQTIEEEMAYDPEFGEKVKPAMVRVFQKKGWGVTDEQYLIGAFAKDLGTKAMVGFSLKKQGNQIIKHFMSMSQQQQAQPQPEVYEPDTMEKPQPKKQPNKKVVEDDDIEEVEEITAEDIENDLK